MTTNASVPAQLEGATGSFGTIMRDDGVTQVTFNNVPLYRFSGDKKAGDTNVRRRRRLVCRPGVWDARGITNNGHPVPGGRLSEHGGPVHGHDCVCSNAHHRRQADRHDRHQRRLQLRLLAPQASSSPDLGSPLLPQRERGGG